MLLAEVAGDGSGQSGSHLAAWPVCGPCLGVYCRRRPPCLEAPSPCGAMPIFATSLHTRSNTCLHDAGAAASQLLEAAKLARQSMAGPESLQPAWKLLGDILLQFSAVSPVLQASNGADDRDAQVHIKRWGFVCLLWQQLKQRAHQQGSAAAVPEEAGHVCCFQFAVPACCGALMSSDGAADAPCKQRPRALILQYRWLLS